MRLLRYLCAVLLLSAGAFCQTTTVTATITDTNGTTYAGGTYSISLSTQAAYYGTGGVCRYVSTSGKLDTTGSLSVTLCDNGQLVSPGGTTYAFQICSPPPTYVPTIPSITTQAPTCFTSTQTVTGATQSLSSALSSASSPYYAVNTVSAQIPNLKVTTCTGCSSNSGTVTHTAGALTSGQVVIGNGAADITVDSALSTSGSGAVTDTTGGTALTLTQGTITTSNPFMSHTATWNAGGVAFTDWLSNLTCTAAATASVAGGLGTAGTQWQFKYGAANCASPQLLSPNGSVTNPAYSFSGSTNTGVYFDGSHSLGFLINGSLAGFASDTAPVGLSANGNAFKGFTSLNSNTNCGAVGTAANPSVVSCVGSIIGSFSCATNASTGTCQVNTSGVTANSEIFVTQRTDTTTGTRLGVTCNTTVDTVQRVITAVTAATSFTINLGTITTNPECFSFMIVN